MGCVETGFKPRFPVAEQFNRDSELPEMHPVIASGFDSLFIEKGLFDLLVKLEVFIRDYSNSTVYVDTESIPVHIRYRLLSYTNQISNSNPSSMTQNAISCGAILFVRTMLPKPPIRSIDYTMLLSKLRAYLSILGDMDPATLDLRVWLLFMGGISSGSSSETDWFVSKLQNVFCMMAINTWEDARQILSRFWWIESLHEDTGRHLWDTVHNPLDATRLSM